MPMCSSSVKWQLNCALPVRCILCITEVLADILLLVNQTGLYTNSQMTKQLTWNTAHIMILLQQRPQNPNSSLNLWISTCTIPCMAYHPAAYGRLSRAPRTSTLYPTHTTVTLHLPAQPLNVLPSIIYQPSWGFH